MGWGHGTSSLPGALPSPLYGGEPSWGDVTHWPPKPNPSDATGTGSRSLKEVRENILLTSLFIMTNGSPLACCRLWLVQVCRENTGRPLCR